MASGNGLASEASGFSFALRQDATSLPAGQPIDFEFQIQSAGGEAVTAFELDQTKLMHFYLIRSDLTGFQHVHPELADDGTWTAPLAAAEPGSYRAYASFIAKDSSGEAVPLALSQPVAVAGAATETPLPAASTSTEVDGYTLTVTGKATAGMEQPITVAFNKDGQSVTDLEPYLDTYAHLTAFHEGDLAFAHLHPEGAVTDKYGGPTLSFGADLPEPGNYRLFLQFQTAGTLHTAALTLSVG